MAVRTPITPAMARELGDAFTRLADSGGKATRALRDLGPALRAVTRALRRHEHSKGWRRHRRRVKAAERSR